VSAEATLVLLHGAGGSRRHWRWLQAELPPAVRTVALDLPGHGDDPGTVPGTLDEAAARVHEAIEGSVRWSGHRVIVAHSLAGLVALRLLSRWPGLATHLVLIGTAARVTPHPLLLQQLWSAEPDRQFLAGTFSAGFPAEREQVVLDDMRRVRLPAGTDPFGAGGTDLSDDLTSIAVPTLVVIARGDRVVSPRRSRALAAGLPNARTAVLDGGHYLHLERPAETAALVLDLTRQSASEDVMKEVSR
jgi:pimeloyl-ACP methyl ester carboxylesterase